VTPGYSGSQLSGYATMTKAIISQLVEPARSEEDRLCIIPGWMNPSDIEEIHRYAIAFYRETLMVPDVRGVMDEKTPRDVRKYNSGGTRVQDICRIGNCSAAIALGEEAAWSAGTALQRKGQMALSKLPLPIGISCTDHYVETLNSLSGQAVPQFIRRERTRLIDVVMELHPQLYGKKAALFCDADVSVPLVRFLAEIGMKPVFVCTGFAKESFEREIKVVFEQYQIDGTVLRQADRFNLEEYVAAHPVDLLLGGTRGKIIGKRFHIPLVRVGFPVIDRPLAYLEPIVCYNGAMRLLRDMLCALRDQEETASVPEQLSFAESF
jgi:nitrogenase molybdenum-iron protein beta chain